MIIQVTDLSYTYPDGTLGLKNINLELSGGKKTAILGMNGSGKTTLLYHFNGTFLPQEGQVNVLGITLDGKTLDKLRPQVGFLFDYPDHQLFATSVAQDVAFGPRNFGVDPQEIDSLVQRALQQVDMETLQHKPPYQLSLGQKKRTAIAGITALAPPLLVCDEPFAGLDPCAAEQFQHMLDTWVQAGRTMVFSTHDIDLAYAWADEAVVMAEGQVLASGPVEQVLEDEAMLRAAKLKPPMLVQLFSKERIKPRNMAEALARMKNISGE